MKDYQPTFFERHNGLYICLGSVIISAIVFSCVFLACLPGMYHP